MKRENIRDFTQIDKLVDLVKDKQIITIKHVLHVLSGCAIPIIEGDITSDDKLNLLLSIERTKFLDEINPSQKFENNNIPSIVKEIQDQLQIMADTWGELLYNKMRKAENKSQLVKFNGGFVLPYEGEVQFLKGKRNVLTKNTTDENNNCTQKQYLHQHRQLTLLLFVLDLHSLD
jgi:hypothetical protein